MEEVKVKISIISTSKMSLSWYSIYILSVARCKGEKEEEEDDNDDAGLIDLTHGWRCLKSSSQLDGFGASKPGSVLESKSARTYVRKWVCVFVQILFSLRFSSYIDRIMNFAQRSKRCTVAAETKLEAWYRHNFVCKITIAWASSCNNSSHNSS